MKLAIFLLTAAIFQAHGNTFAQKVTLSGKEITLKQVFAAIEKQTDYVVFSNESFLSGSHKVSVTVHEVSVEELLNLVLKDQPIQYSIRNKTIILSQKVIVPKSITEFLRGEPPPIVINGVIRAVEGEFLAGVSVRVKGSSNGVTTDGKGIFQIKSSAENFVLQISMIGYETSEITIKKVENDYQVKSSSAGFTADTKTPGQIILSLNLKKSVSQLDEMQVTAYGKTSRRMAISNIGSIKGEDIEKMPVMTATEAMIGRVPGLSIQRMSGNSSAPVRVVIRGRNSLNRNTDPLYVVDGIPLVYLNASTTTGSIGISTGPVQAGQTNSVGENPLFSINPRDIERIDVLKDADGIAIYGSRGANGVILITTKKAKAGPTRLSIDVQRGIKFNQRYPQLPDTKEYLAVRREAFRNDGILPDIYNAPDLMLWDTTKYTDWRRELVGIGNTTTVNASVSGGMSQTNYRLSGSYASEQEILNLDGKNQRTTFASSIGHASVDQKFRLNAGTNLSFSDIKVYGMGALPGSLPPNAPDIYNEKGEFNFEPYRDQYQSVFPFSPLKRPSVSKTTIFAANIALQYEVTKELIVSTTIGYNYSNNENNTIVPAASLDPAFRVVSSANYGSTVNKGWQVEPQLQYKKLIGKGDLSVQVIGNLNNVVTNSRLTFAQMFPNDALMKSATNARLVMSQDAFKQYRYISGSALINYSWDGKYIIKLSGRRDGSSRFGPGKQFGNFGSLGLGWNISEEKWMKRIMPSWFNYLKLSGNTGIVGGDVYSDYEYLSHWGNSFLSGSSYLLPNYNGTMAFHVQRPLNQDYRWEGSRRSDIMLSMGFLKDKITFTINAYKNLSKNKITNLDQPLYTGFAQVLGNSLAAVQNKGVEITLGVKLVNKEDWHVSLDFNVSTNKNTLADYPGLESSPDKGLYKVGASMDARYLLKYTGIDPLTGSFTFEDANKDGRVTTGQGFPLSALDDRRILIDMNDKYYGGLVVNAGYKRISLSTNFSFTNKYRPNPLFQGLPGEQINFILPEEVKNNHWQKPGDIVKFPRYTTRVTELGPFQNSDGYYVKVKYLRMVSLNLAYSLPEKWLSKTGIKSAGFAIGTGNIFTLSSFKGFDPDVDGVTNTIPISRVITTSLRLSF
ncbi:SusC/RagA family TonB-linked outer membrane protein [Pseudobacter ginsenosidimutans]|uniref:TonB-linked SusC/RagA family outer membrane protein n=1 Tax=Pseudobacter ginsenosidimutans TaxID=661488 RepID=A0A4Q7N572_9BACT|nr:SusC/RagA family TonB-linked outer membrane protein [Pseudobacter ginsenosidimutans]RZS76194.1 TonB-linked SusC/RagA family outer membrane protein [Pseudobacter ginsenosidimutans]